MSNNFWFNYYKDKEKLKDDNSNINNNITDDNYINETKQSYDKRKIAFIKLGIGVLFIVILSVILNMNTSNNNNNLIDDDNKESNTTSDDFIFFKLDNYDYNIDISIQSYDEEYNLSYKGSVINNEIEGMLCMNSIEAKYIYKDGKYYALEDDEYIKVSEDEIYPIIDYEYLNINNINKYLNNATLEYTNEEIGRKYLVKVSDIINSDSTDNITITYIMENNILKLYIDYTNLIKIINSNISACNIAFEYVLLD